MLDSNRATMADRELYEVRRASTLDPWGTPQVVPQAPSLHVSGQVVYFEAGSGGADLFWSFRPSLASPWSAPVEIAELDVDDEGDPWISSDQRTLYFSRSIAGARTLYLSTRM